MCQKWNLCTRGVVLDNHLVTESHWLVILQATQLRTKLLWFSMLFLYLSSQSISVYCLVLTDIDFRSKFHGELRYKQFIIWQLISFPSILWIGSCFKFNLVFDWLNYPAWQFHGDVVDGVSFTCLLCWVFLIATKATIWCIQMCISYSDVTWLCVF